MTSRLSHVSVNKFLDLGVRDMWLIHTIQVYFRSRMLYVFFEIFDLFICMKWLIHMTWLIHMRHDLFIWHDSFIWDMTHSCETWLIHMRHDSFIWDMTHSYETWLIHMRHDSLYVVIQRSDARSVDIAMTHSYETWLIHVRHDSFIWAHSDVWSVDGWGRTVLHTTARNTVTNWFDSFICVIWLN